MRRLAHIAALALLAVSSPARAAVVLFEGGERGVNATLADSGSCVPYSISNQNGASSARVDWSTTQVRSGQFAFKYNQANGTTTGSQMDWDTAKFAWNSCDSTGSGQLCWAQICAFYPTSTTLGATAKLLIGLSSAAGADPVQVTAVDDAGGGVQWAFSFGGGSATSVVTENAWHCMQMGWEANGSGTSKGEWWVDGVRVYTSSSLTAGSTATYVMSSVQNNSGVGPPTAGYSLNAVFYFDDIVGIDDSGGVVGRPIDAKVTLGQLEQQCQISAGWGTATGTGCSTGARQTCIDDNSVSTDRTSDGATTNIGGNTNGWLACAAPTPGWAMPTPAAGEVVKAIQAESCSSISSGTSTTNTLEIRSYGTTANNCSKTISNSTSYTYDTLIAEGAPDGAGTCTGTLSTANINDAAAGMTRVASTFRCSALWFEQLLVGPTPTPTYTPTNTPTLTFTPTPTPTATPTVTPTSPRGSHQMIL